MSRTPSAEPSLDGGLIRFEIRSGLHRVTFTVADEALEAASGLTVPSTVAERRRSFDRFRTLVNAAAEIKLKSLPLSSTGPIILTSDDLRCVPSEKGAPSFGSAGRSTVRAAVVAVRPSGVAT